MTQTVRLACAAVAALLLWGSPAAAQIEPEVGVSAGAVIVVPLDTAGSVRHVGELQASIAAPLTEHWAAGALFSIGRQTTLFERRVEGEYGFHVKAYRSPDAVASPFISVGAVGRYFHRTGRFGSDFEGVPPVLPTVGGGVRVGLEPRLALEAGADVVWYRARPLGVRAMAGVTVPIGE